MDQSSVPVSDPDSLLRALLSSSGDCIKILDLDGNLIYMTEGGQRIMEVTDFNAIKGCAWPDFWRDEGNTNARAAVAAARAGGTGHFQGFATTVAGTPEMVGRHGHAGTRCRWQSGQAAFSLARHHRCTAGR